MTAQNQFGKETMTMGNTNDPDETAVMDLALFRRHLVARLGADGDFCDRDRALVAEYDPIRTGLAVRIRARRALEACLRNGVSYYTRTLGRDAGIAFVADGEQVTNVVPYEKRPDGGNHPDAA